LACQWPATVQRALIEHWPWAAEKGVMNKNTAAGLRAACVQVLGGPGRPCTSRRSDQWKPNARRKEMPNKRSAEGEYRVEGSVLDELGLDRQAALELKLKAALHQKILQLVRRRKYRARDLERILQIQQPRVSELTRGKLSTLSVARLLLYADLLGAEAEVKLKQIRAHAAA
jgi:predicted XRE-type DNA-binding protein